MKKKNNKPREREVVGELAIGGLNLLMQQINIKFENRQKKWVQETNQLIIERLLP